MNCILLSAITGAALADFMNLSLVGEEAIPFSMAVSSCLRTDSSWCAGASILSGRTSASCLHWTGRRPEGAEASPAWSRSSTSNALTN